MATPQRVTRIVSTDVGIDDALALVLLHSLPDPPIDCIVATGGNVSLQDVGRNCAFLKRTFGWETELFAGTEPPRPGRVRHAAEVHGPHGLGEHASPEAELPPLRQLETRLLEGRAELDLLVLGPATDAAALLSHPELARRVRRLFLMGGAFEERSGRLGNVTPFAEFNVYMDPKAAWEAVRLGPPAEFVPLDATERRLFTAEELLPPRPRTGTVRLVADLIEYLRKAHLRLGLGDGVYVHDVIAAAVWAGIVAAEWSETGVREVIPSGERRGMIVRDGPDAPRVRYARQVDEEGFLRAWRQALAAL